MADTPRLLLPEIAAAQAQKHVTHNEALITLDALVDLFILNRDLTAPPGGETDGDTYLVAAIATGAWAGQDGNIAYRVDADWRFYAPFGGLRAYIDDEGAFLFYDGASWVDFSSVLNLQNVPLLGVNTTADATNKLAVKSAAVLFDNIGADSQVKVNKAATGDTASHLFQTGFSGRAEFGLTGDDDFHAKVSPDGSTWYDGFLIDKSTGNVTFPSGAGEAGTWTPTLSCATLGDWSWGDALDYGSGYRVIGGHVFAWFDFYGTPTFTTASGNLRIGTLPFAAVSPGRPTALGWSGSMRQVSLGFTWPAGVTDLHCLVGGGLTYLNLKGLKTGSNATFFTTTTIVSGAALRLAGQIWYRT